MKKLRYVLYTFALAITLSACFEAEQDNPLIAGTCFDAVQNQNEEGVDCGGICQACAIVRPVEVAPCKTSLKDNIVVANGYSKQVLSDEYYVNFTTPSSSMDHFEFYFPFLDTYDSRSLYSITVNTSQYSAPYKNFTYDLVSNSWLQENEASIILRDSFGYIYSYQGTGGKLYLTFKYGVYTFEFCDLPFKGYYDNNSFNISGRIVYKSE